LIAKYTIEPITGRMMMNRIQATVFPAVR